MIPGGGVFFFLVRLLEGLLELFGVREGRGGFYAYYYTAHSRYGIALLERGV